MSFVVLFHSVCGLRPAVTEAAKRLGEAGHEVLAPDLYGGRVAEAAELTWQRVLAFLAA